MEIYLPGYRVVIEVLGDYELLERLGAGAFGETFKVRSISTGRFYALKLFMGDEAEQSFENELHAYELLSQAPECAPFIVCLRDAGTFEEEELQGYFLVLDLMDGTLDDFVKKVDSPASLRFILRQVMRGLAYIHGLGLAHKDLNPENILYRVTEPEEPFSVNNIEDVQSRLEVKIGDLGLTCGTESLRECDIMMNPTFRSPELIQKDIEAEEAVDAGEAYTLPSITVEEAQKNDIWSLGVTFWYLKFGFSLIVATENIQTQEDIPWVDRCSDTANRDEEIVNTILNQCLTYEPAQRPTLSVLMNIMAQ